MEISFGFNEDLVTELQPVNGSNFNEASSASSSESKPPTDIYGGGSAGQVARPGNPATMKPLTVFSFSFTIDAHSLKWSKRRHAGEVVP